LAVPLKLAACTPEVAPPGPHWGKTIFETKVLNESFFSRRGSKDVGV